MISLPVPHITPPFLPQPRFTMRCPRPTHLLVAMAIALLSASSVIRGCDAGCTVQDAQCYVDAKSRILGDPNPDMKIIWDRSIAGVMTPKYCAQLCEDEGMPLAGVENGGECFCGEAVASGAVTVATMQCNTPCSGRDQSHPDYAWYCGATWR